MIHTHRMVGLFSFSKYYRVSTASVTPAVAEHVRALGADAVVQKPMSVPQFMALGDLIKGVVWGNRRA